MTLEQVQEKQTATDIVVSNIQAQIQHRLASQSFQNLEENVGAMRLRSGKELKKPRKIREVEHEVEV